MTAETKGRIRNGVEHLEKHARGDVVFLCATLAYFLDKLVAKLDTIVELLRQVAAR